MTHTFSPGDRVRNTVYDREGIVVDDAEVGFSSFGTVAVRYDDSPQIWFVLPATLFPVGRGEDER